MAEIVENNVSAGGAPRILAFNLNGDAVTVEGDHDCSLLDVLRDRCGIISPKNGCSPMAQCGCCAVLVDGQPKLSCGFKASRVAGKTVTTTEGFSGELREQVADCFVRAGGVQCGFCIPGIVVRAVALLDRNPDPSREQIANSLKSHLCRCTGYTKILDAIELLARVRRGESLPPADTTGRVGTRMDRYQAGEFVLGDFKYIDDITVEGSLFAAMRFSDHPRALVKSIDVEPALEHPGVVRVVTASDVPGQRHVGLIIPDWPILVAVGEETRYVGDILAIAVADDQLAAREAAARIAVDYEVREPITTPQDGLKPDAPQIHPNGNLLSQSEICRGDVENALAASTYVVEGHYSTQMVEHMFLEPEACIAIPTAAEGNGRPTLKVLTQGQGVFDDRRQIASVLGWDEERLYVELVSNGGAFGGKEDMSIQAQTALAAVLCDKPVKCTLTREESFRLHPKRHPVQMHVKVGCDAEGRLTALWSRIIGDKGAYASVGAKVLERAAGHATGPYRFPNIDIESKAVYTNNPPCGAMRGFGANQSAFAIERALDRLAKKVGIDGWEMRWRNVLEVGDRFCTGQRLTKPFGLKQTLLAVRDQYRAAKYAGIACGIKNVGIGNGLPDRGKAVLTVEAADRVTIKTGFTEMGQGYFTICIQTACQETGLPPEIFEPLCDTSAEVDCGQTTASRATVLGGLAIIEAAKKLKADLDKHSALSRRVGLDPPEHARGDLGPQMVGLDPPYVSSALASLIGRQYRGDYACIYTNKLGADVPEPKTHLTYGFASQVVILDDEGRLKKVIAAHDVGKVMNPTLLEGQMEGSIHMGLGYALTEDFVVEGGRIQSKDVMSLGVLRAHQMPEIETIFIEEPDPETAYGARGVGEIGLVPTAPAVAAALEAFDGIHRTQLPMKDSPAAAALGVKRRS